jgi:hypothetical protein
MNPGNGPEFSRQQPRGNNRYLPNNKHPHELSNIHQSNVLQCSSYLKENTVGMHYKNQPLKHFRKIGDKC